MVQYGRLDCQGEILEMLDIHEGLQDGGDMSEVCGQFDAA